MMSDFVLIKKRLIKSVRILLAAIYKSYVIRFRIN